MWLVARTLVQYIVRASPFSLLETLSIIQAITTIPFISVASLFWEEEELDLADTNMLGVGDDLFGGKYPQDDGGGGVE